jgi:branched-chain amino acid aminotransferase
MDHGLLYGDGVFEGFRFYNHNIFKVLEHLQRLQQSAAAISLHIPMHTDELLSALNEAVTAAEIADGYIRLLVTRGTGSLGVDPAKCKQPQVIIIVDELSMVDEQVLVEGASLIISSVRRLMPDQLDPRIKSLNYMNQVMARLEANFAGADEAIMLNQQGRVAEGTADNVFLIKDECVLTPPSSEGPLAGITRSTILDCARDIGIAVQEIPISPYDLYTADECFLSGTGAELIPVKEISGRRMKTVRGPVFIQLLNAYRCMTRGSQTHTC